MRPMRRLCVMTRRKPDRAHKPLPIRRKRQMGKRLRPDAAGHALKAGDLRVAKRSTINCYASCPAPTLFRALGSSPTELAQDRPRARWAQRRSIATPYASHAPESRQPVDFLPDSSSYCMRFRQASNCLFFGKHAVLIIDRRLSLTLKACGSAHLGTGLAQCHTGACDG